MWQLRLDSTDCQPSANWRSKGESICKNSSPLHEHRVRDEGQCVTSHVLIDGSACALSRAFSEQCVQAWPFCASAAHVN